MSVRKNKKKRRKFFSSKEKLATINLWIDTIDFLNEQAEKVEYESKEWWELRRKVLKIESKILKMLK